MRVTDAQVAALRAFLTRDPDAALSLAAQLGEHEMDGYLHLAEAALGLLAGWRFWPRFTRADLISYVASLRASRAGDGTEYDLDPAAAENLLRYLLGSAHARIPDARQRIPTVMALLDALAASELPGQTEVEALLDQARHLAAAR